MGKKSAKKKKKKRASSSDDDANDDIDEEQPKNLLLVTLLAASGRFLQGQCEAEEKAASVPMSTCSKCSLTVVSLCMVVCPICDMKFCWDCRLEAVVSCCGHDRQQESHGEEVLAQMQLRAASLFSKPCIHWTDGEAIQLHVFMSTAGLQLYTALMCNNCKFPASIFF